MTVYVIKVLMGNKTIQSVECTSQEILGLGSLLVLISITGTLFNVMVVITLLRNRFLRSSNNCLVANLAATDAIYLGMTSVTSLFAIVTVEWRFSHGACVFIGYVSHITYTTSINICIFISFHRFVSIVYPQKRFVSSIREAQQSVTSIWCISGLICLPGVLKSSAYIFNPVVRTCTIFGVLDGDGFYVMYTFLVNFLCPASIMATCYVRIYQAVEIPSTKMDLIRHHTKIIKRKSKNLMVAVLSIFLITWLPYNVALMYSAFATKPLPSSIIITVWILKLLNTVSNPILYAFCNRLYFRCMIRLLKCRGPLRSKLSAIVSRDRLEDGEYYASYPTGAITGDKVSTCHNLPFTCSECQLQARITSARRGPLSVPSLISNGTQTARLSTVAEQEDEDEVEPEISGIREEPSEAKDSNCSCRSSVPTVMKYPIKRFRRSLSTSSQISHFAYGPTPTDSGRSSFVSQYIPTPGFNSNRTSISSQFLPTPAGSARNSVTSQYQHFYNTPQGSVCNTPAVPETPGHRIRRVLSLSSRQSFYSSLSASRSARSSLSSRMSHYNPNVSYSARSSVISQLLSNQSTPFSTRPSTPGTQEDGELMTGFNPGPVDSPRTHHRFSFAGRSANNRNQPLPVFHILPEEYGIFEGLEEESDTNSRPESPLAATPDPCSRLSALMLGDVDPAEFGENIEEEEERLNIARAVTDNVKKAMKAWDYGMQKLGRPSSRISRIDGDNAINASFSPRGSPRNSPRNSYSSPRASRSSPRASKSRGPQEPGHRERVDTIMEDVISESNANLQEQKRKDSLIDSIHKAVNLVLKAKRMRSRLRSLVVPIKPDTPVPQIQPPSPTRCKGPLGNGTCSRMNVREPIRFVYERPIPNNYFTYGQKPMSRLRVPGRPPPLNVPQTIIEEDLPTELLPETPTTRRRKNASTWIAPPVIDVDEGQDKQSTGMRVECPGVLVEHHH